MNSRVKVTGFQRLCFALYVLQLDCSGSLAFVWRRPAPVCCPATHSSRDPATGDLKSTSERKEKREREKERERGRQGERERGRESGRERDANSTLTSRAVTRAIFSCACGSRFSSSHCSVLCVRCLRNIHHLARMPSFARCLTRTDFIHRALLPHLLCCSLHKLDSCLADLLNSLRSQVMSPTLRLK